MAQSIEGGASSFTAHIRTCKAALAAAESDRHAQQHSLVVLDEPGASTDPLQGAAIARAVIEALLDAGALVLASTHSDALKKLGLADERIAVGAMAISGGGEPLYKLVVGAVGSSHAFDAAAREGLPAATLERARRLLPDADADGGAMRAEMETLLEALQQTRGEAAADREAAAKEKALAEASVAEARAAAAQAAKSLKQSEAWLQELTNRLDTMVARLRADETDALELLGETLRGLRLGQQDAATARANALAALGLQALAPDAALRRGESVSIVPLKGGLRNARALVEGELAESVAAYEEQLLVAVGGAPPVLVDRSECAVWLGFGGGAAADGDAWGADKDVWAWMAGGAPSAAAAAPSSSMRKRR